MRKTNLFYLFIVVSLLGFSTITKAQVNGVAVDPKVSTLANPIYYYIESASDGSKSVLGFTGDFRGHVVFPAGDNAKMSYGAIPTNKDNALWAIIKDGEKLLLYNKGTGFYQKDSHSASSNTKQGVGYIRNLGTSGQYSIYSDGVAAQSRLLAWKGGRTDRWKPNLGDNSLTAWYFVLPKADLDLAIANATNLMNSSAEGTTQPGEYSPGDMELLNTEIDVAKEVRDNPSSTQAQKEEAANNLNTAVLEFQSSAVPLATDGSVWYFIKGQRGGAAGAVYAESQGADNIIASKTQAYVNEQAWSIVPNDVGYAIKNRSDNSYLDSDAGTDVKTVVTMPTRKLLFNERGTDDTEHINYYQIEGPESAVVFRLHSRTSGDLMNYHNSLYDNTKYQFIAAPVTEDATNSPASGDVSAGSAVVVTSATADAMVYYTLDGTEPTTSSSSVVSGGSITLPATVGSLTIKTLSVAPEHFPSMVVASTYNVTPTGLIDNKISNSIVVNEGVVSVTGTDDYEIYSVAGQRQHKNTVLQAGIYIVKVKDQIYKIMIK